MNRRIFFAGILASPAIPAMGGTPATYEASLISGGEKGGTWLAGARVALAPGWKTYWRVPGESGIPPQFDFAGSVNVARTQVNYPLPQRFKDQGGEAIGYHDEVVFPVMVTPEDTRAPVILKLNLAFAVCRDICIPARAQAILDLERAPASSVVEMWQGRVPQVRQGRPIRKAEVRMSGGKPVLALDVEGAPRDIFIEGSTTAYFGKPREGDATGEFLLPISNLANPKALENSRLIATLDMGGTGVEQSIAVT
jgi:DsbC/DsbD-like thiol-disulfide interchange protein